MDSKAYSRAREALGKSSHDGCHGVKKWEREENAALLKKAIKDLNKNLDIEKAAKILGRSRSYTAILLKQHYPYAYQEYVDLKRATSCSKGGNKGSQTAAKKKQKYNKRLSDGGFNQKDYSAYLTQSRQTKRDMTQEIILLNSTIEKAVEEGKPQIEIDILRRKRGMAKSHFKYLKY